MKTFIQKLLKSEKGLSLPLVLGVLALGSVLIVPCLQFADTMLVSVRHQEVKNQGIFAADAGMEIAIWHIKAGDPIPTCLPQSVNGMTVNIQATNQGEYMLYNGTLHEAAGHSAAAFVMTKSVVPVTSNTSRFTIEVWKTDEADGNVKLAGVGAKLPTGYQYVADSANNATNVSQLEPIDVTDSEGAHLLNWKFDDLINMTTGYHYTETFLITGTSGSTDYYAWADASRQDTGGIGEFFGDVYEITATAKQGTNTIATVEAKVMNTYANPVIVSWRPS